MNLQNLQTALARRVREIPLLKGLPVFEEEKGNVIAKIEEEIPRSFFCVVVGAVSFADKAPDAAVCYGEATVAVTVFEDPFLNRETPGKPSFLAAAQEIAKSLKLFDTGDGVLTSPSISEPADVGGGVVAATVRFAVTVTL